MFKKNGIVTLVLISVTLATILASCDGRISSREALKESIETFNKEVNLEVHKYIPDGHFESRVDTVLNTGYKILVKISTDAFNDVVVTRIKDTVNYQLHYRKFVLDIEVEKNSNVIFSEKFPRHRINDLLLESGLVLHDFDKFVLYAHQINHEASNEHNIVIDLAYIIPESNEKHEFQLIIQLGGQIELKPTLSS